MLYMLYSVTDEPGQGVNDVYGCIAVAYSLYSEFPYSKVYSHTLPAVVFWGQWHRDMVGGARV